MSTKMRCCCPRSRLRLRSACGRPRRSRSGGRCWKSARGRAGGLFREGSGTGGLRWESARGHTDGLCCRRSCAGGLRWESVSRGWGSTKRRAGILWRGWSRPGGRCRVGVRGHDHGPCVWGSRAGGLSSVSVALESIAPSDSAWRSSSESVSGDCSLNSPSVAPEEPSGSLLSPASVSSGAGGSPRSAV